MKEKNLRKKLLVNKIIFIGPFPPPLGGISVLNNEIYNYIQKNNEIRVEDKIDTSRNKNIWDLFQLLQKTISSEKKTYFIQINGSFICIREYILILFLKYHNERVVVHLHASIKKKLRNFPFNGTTWINRYFINKLIKKIDVCIFISEHILKEFKPLLAPNNFQKCISVENFINCKEFSREKIKDEYFNIIYIGRISSQKGIKNIMDVLPYFYQNHPYVKFHLAGQIVKKEFTNNQLELLEFYTTKNLEIYPPMYGEDKYNFFAKGDIFIYPSHHEVFPVTIIEAMASSLPIIATPVGINEKFLKQGENCLFVPVNNSLKLQENIIYLINNGALRKKMAEMNKTEAVKYDQEIAMNKFLKVLA